MGDVLFPEDRTQKDPLSVSSVGWCLRFSAACMSRAACLTDLALGKEMVLWVPRIPAAWHQTTVPNLSPGYSVFLDPDSKWCCSFADNRDTVPNPEETDKGYFIASFKRAGVALPVIAR